jgi:hypothetical protein
MNAAMIRCAQYVMDGQKAGYTRWIDGTKDGRYLMFWIGIKSRQNTRLSPHCANYGNQDNQGNQDRIRIAAIKTVCRPDCI